MKRFSFFAFCMVIVFLSCKKPPSDLNPVKHGVVVSDPNPVKHGVDVYILGYCDVSPAIRVGGYWKNGIFKALTAINTWSDVNSMTVNGKDIYITGYYSQGANGSGGDSAAYWKNGVLVPMPDAVSLPCIAIKGGDVYLGGGTWASNGWDINPTYWKNGVKHVLDYVPPPGPPPFYGNEVAVTSITFAGNDVYMTSNEPDQLGYWKNDAFISIPNSTTTLYGIYISGEGDIYRCGRMPLDASADIAFYSKNDVITKLGNITDQIARPRAIIVAGTDVYCAGTIEGAGLGLSPCYWKNGVITKLDNGGKPGNYTSVLGIAVDGANIYISGNDNVPLSPGLAQAFYWLNGRKMVLDNPYYVPNDPNNNSSAGQIVLVRY